MTALTILALGQIFVLKGKGCLLKGLFITVLGGVGLLLLLSMAEPFLGFSLPLTKGTLLFSGILGIPGALLLCFGQIFQGMF